MVSPPNNAQDLSEIIPDYTGYERREARKKSDTSFRNALTEKMNHTHAALEKLNHQFKKQGKQDLAQTISKVQVQLATVTQNLQDPAYSDTEFFERELLPEGLRKIHNYDRAMTEQAQTLFEEVNELDRMQSSEQELSDILNHLLDVIDGFNQNLIEREFVIAGVDEDF